MYTAIEAIKQLDSTVTVKEQQITKDSTTIQTLTASHDSLRTVVVGLNNSYDSLRSAFSAVRRCIEAACNNAPDKQKGGNSGGNNRGGDTSAAPPNGGGVQQDVVLSSSFESPLLYQNVPNPFSTGGTKINYYLPEGVQGASIAFYDEYGNQLKVANLSQTGNGTLNIEPENLANGIYSYSLIVGGKVVDTKRMMMQK